MSRHVTLRARIKRLEKRRASQRSRQTVLLTVVDACESQIAGIQSPCGMITDRREGEALQSLASRHAGAAGSARIGYAVYEAGALDFLP